MTRPEQRSGGGDVRVVRASAGGRVDAALAERLADLSRSQIARLIADGHLKVDGAPCTRPAHKVDAGATLELTVPPAAPPAAQAEAIDIDIVHEDRDLVVVNKAAGMVVHPSAGHATGTLVNALLHRVQGLSGVGGVERPGIVHRLDRGTSGLIVVAKHDRAHQHLAAQFAAHTAQRRYLALCLGAPSEGSGTIRSMIARHPADRLRFSSCDGSRGRRAVTHWRVLQRSRGLALIECALETGRTHQIRVHLSEQGWPLAGDDVYAGARGRVPDWLREWLPERRPMLHAWRLRFAHLDGTVCRFKAPVPDDMAAALHATSMDVPQVL